MKNITLSAEEALIEQARLTAHSEHTTLNAAFRNWLQEYASRSGSANEFDSLMKRLSGVHSGGSFTREQMNERR